MNVRVIARGGAASQVPERLSLSGESKPGGARPNGVLRSANSVRCRRRCAGVATSAANGRRGPLLVEEFDSTTVVPPDGRARVIAWDTIEIEIA